ncbi:MAG: CBS domain-containing protein [Candidatus Aenigmarchaeota archaeon]|nr:CBS domain-containing protein [Candidatus Aenigmarchaeota archaeon]
MNYNVLVGQIMQRNVKTVELGESVENAARIMKESRIGSVVITGEKHVKGIVTSTDIVHKYVAEKKGGNVEDIMTTDLVKISPNRTIEEASRLMVSKKVEKLLVFDKELFVGIVTATDILKVEPALVETLLERMKLGTRSGRGEEELGFSQCENCGNYTDDTEEVGGAYVCSECRD